MAKYECKVCGYIYNEQYVGKTFEEMYSCPICDAGKEAFKMIEEEPEESNVWNLSDEDADSNIEKEFQMKSADQMPVEEDEMVTESTTEPVMESVAEFVAEPTVESVVEAVTEPTDNEVFFEEAAPVDEAPKTEFVVERRQEFWTDSSASESGTEETKESERKTNAWGTGSVSRVLDFTNPDKPETTEIQKDEPVIVEPVHNEFIETIYGNAVPVKTEEELKKEEEKKEAEEQKNLLNIGGGTIHTVIDPAATSQETVIKEEKSDMPAEEVKDVPKPEGNQGVPWQPVQFDTQPEAATEPETMAVSEDAGNETGAGGMPEQEEEAFVFIEADENVVNTEGTVPDFFESTVDDFNQFGKSEETFFDDSEEDGIDAEQDAVFTVNEEAPDPSEEAAGEYKEILPEEDTAEEFVNIPEDTTEEVLFEEAIADEAQEEAVPVMEEESEPAEKVVIPTPFIVKTSEPVAEAQETPEKIMAEVTEEEPSFSTMAKESKMETDRNMKDNENRTEVTEERKDMDEEIVVYSMLKGKTKYSILCDDEARKMFDNYSVGEEAVSNGLEDIILLPAQLNPVPLSKNEPVECRTVIGRFTNCPVEILQPFCFSKLILWGEHIPGRDNEEDLSNQALILIKGQEGHIPDVTSKEELRREVVNAKVRSAGTPVGIDLIAGRIEKDLEACVYAGVDFVILNDLTSRILPYALRRAKNYLNRVNSKIEIIVCVDALKDAQELAKMLAMGADLVLIERGYDLKMSNRITEDLIEITRSTGHRNVHDINMTDICTVNGDIADHTDIDHV